MFLYLTDRTVFWHIWKNDNTLGKLVSRNDSIYFFVFISEYSSAAAVVSTPQAKQAAAARANEALQAKWIAVAAAQWAPLDKWAATVAGAPQAKQPTASDRGSVQDK